MAKTYYITKLVLGYYCFMSIEIMIADNNHINYIISLVDPRQHMTKELTIYQFKVLFWIEIFGFFSSISSL